MNTTTTNLNGYSGTIGTATPLLGTATPLSGNINTIVSSGTGITISGNSTINYPNNLGLSTAISNSNNMNRQVKVAVFSIERNDKGTITSSKFVKELWIEQRNGASIELAVAKQLDKDFDPANIIIREIYSVNL